MWIHTIDNGQSLNEDDLEHDSDHEGPKNIADDEVSIGDEDDDDDMASDDSASISFNNTRQ